MGRDPDGGMGLGPPGTSVTPFLDLGVGPGFMLACAVLVPGGPVVLEFTRWSQKIVRETGNGRSRSTIRIHDPRSRPRCPAPFDTMPDHALVIPRPPRGPGRTLFYLLEVTPGLVPGGQVVPSPQVGLRRSVRKTETRPITKMTRQPITIHDQDHDPRSRSRSKGGRSDANIYGNGYGNR